MNDSELRMKFLGKQSYQYGEIFAAYDYYLKSLEATVIELMAPLYTALSLDIKNATLYKKAEATRFLAGYHGFKHPFISELYGVLRVKVDMVVPEVYLILRSKHKSDSSMSEMIRARLPADKFDVEPKGNLRLSVQLVGNADKNLVENAGKNLDRIVSDFHSLTAGVGKVLRKLSSSR